MNAIWHEWARGRLALCYLDFHHDRCLWVEQGEIDSALQNKEFPETEKEFSEFCFNTLGYVPVPGEEYDDDQRHLIEEVIK